MNDDGNRWRPWRDRPLVFGAPTIGTADPWYRRHHGERTGTLPGAEWVSARTFSLPLSAGMSDGDVSDVARALRVIFS